MTPHDSLNNVLEVVELQMREYNVLMSEVMNRWGVQKAVDELEKLSDSNVMGLDVFVSSWMKLLNASLESAIWLCVYERMRLSETQKEAMKKADEALKNYSKGTKNAF